MYLISFLFQLMFILFIAKKMWFMVLVLLYHQFKPVCLFFFISEKKNRFGRT